jgi:hypothetical protein
MGKNGDQGDQGEDGTSVDVILPEGFGSSFSTKEIRAKVRVDFFYILRRIKSFQSFLGLIV